MAAAIRSAVEGVIYQMQRLDAFLLNTLYRNVQRMQDRVHGIPPSATGSFIPNRGGSFPSQIPSLTADGLTRLDPSDPDVVALQVAPWTFLTSPYSYSLIAMAILLSRIQHNVVPTHDRHASRLGSWVPHLLPIDPSATRTRLFMRILSLYLLYKSVIRMTIIVFQAFDLFPDFRILSTLGKWASHASMVDVSWSAFVAVCAAMIIGTFNRGLDGDPFFPSSFNLPHFAFMLHLYSSPLGSVFNRVEDPLQGQQPAPRPSGHVLITLLLPLLQITLIHTQGVWKRYNRQVRLPTFTCGFIGMAHFIYVIVSKKILDYPLLQMIPSSLELFLLTIIFCTTGLNAASQLLLQGRIVKPLFSEGAGAFPSSDEEYSIALLRLGSSCLDATKVAGLGNEAAAVSSLEGVVQLGPFGVVSLSHPEKHTGNKSQRKRPVNPFAREIKHVKAVSVDSDVWISQARVKGLFRFALSLWNFTKGAWRTLRSRSLTKEHNSQIIYPDPTEHETDSFGGNREVPNVYRRFLDGEAITDGESEFESEQMGSSPSSDAESDDESIRNDDGHSGHNEEELEAGEDLDETVGLYSEHGIQRESTPLAPVLLAHLTSSDSPLTRRRYTSLIRRQDEDGADTLLHGYQAIRGFSSSRTSRLKPIYPISQDHDRNEERDTNRRLCVICMCNERIVICWPCRCLSMCDDCRSNLASRTGPSKHYCPCCRQTVEGFSRIFIP